MLLNLAARLRHGLLPTEFGEKAIDCSTMAPIRRCGSSMRSGSTTATPAMTRQRASFSALFTRSSKAIAKAPRGSFMPMMPACWLRAAMTAPQVWMNAKTGDHLITPRNGRPVELNALWYNAVRIAAEWSDRFGQIARGKKLAKYAATIENAFNEQFWNANAHCCYDVLDDQARDASIRPNQLLAISLPFPVLAVERHISAIETVRRELLTPVGLRTLSPKDHAYQGRYVGDALSRNRAMHQGCVHPWLLGQFITAQTRAFGKAAPVREQSRRLLHKSLDHMRHAGLGQLCELFDGDSPHRPGGADRTAQPLLASCCGAMSKIFWTCGRTMRYTGIFSHSWRSRFPKSRPKRHDDPRFGYRLLFRQSRDSARHRPSSDELPANHFPPVTTAYARR